MAEEEPDAWFEGSPDLELARQVGEAVRGCEEEPTRAALIALRNEISGALAIGREEIRAAIGNTNMRCLVQRISEANELLGDASICSICRQRHGHEVEHACE